MTWYERWRKVNERWGDTREEEDNAHCLKECCISQCETHSGPMLVYDIMPSSDSVKYHIFEDSDISREKTMCFVLFSRNAAFVSGPMLFKGIMHSSVKHHIFEHSDLTQHSGRISCQQRLGASVCYRRTCSPIGQNSDLKLRLENG